MLHNLCRFYCIVYSWMAALQRAINQLRDSTINSVVDSSRSRNERTDVMPIKEARASTTSVFSLDDADLFNFDDDDFLQDSFSLSSSSNTVQPTARTSASSIVGNSNTILQPCPSNTTTAYQPAQPLPSVLQSKKQTSPCSRRDFNSSLLSISQPKSTSLPNTQTTDTNMSSPSVPNSIKKLRSFKFVKTGKKRPSDATDEFPQSSSSHPPQAKRRPVFDSVADREKINTEGGGDDWGLSDDTTSLDKNTPFKQPSFNPRFTNTSSSELSSTPTRNTLSSIQQQQQCETTPTIQATTPTCSFPPRRTPLSSNLSTPLSSQHTPQTQVSAINRNRTPLNFTPVSSTSRQTVNTLPSEMFSTPRNSRNATPMVCTPTDNRIVVGTPVSVRRKFPGPAGLLPSLPPGQNLDSIIIPPPSTPQPASTPRTTTISASETESDDPEDFSTGPWVDMLEDLDMSDVHSSALLQYSIHSMIKQAVKKRLKGGKVLHLRVLVKNLVPAGNNASAILKDPTGEVLCTIHHKVLEEHQKELQPGAVLVLRQVSVFSPTPRKHYLNITPNNIVRIYPPDSKREAKSNRTPLVLSESDVENRSSQDSGGGCGSNLRVPKQSLLPSHSQTHQQENLARKKPLYMTSRQLPFVNNSSECRNSWLENEFEDRQCTSRSLKRDKQQDCFTAMETEVQVDYNESNVLFEDLDDFDDFGTDEQMSASVAARSSGVVGSDGDNVMVSDSWEGGSRTKCKDGLGREATFFNQFCEDEFDSLVNDLDF